jgi:hypothetical protein
MSDLIAIVALALAVILWADMSHMQEDMRAFNTCVSEVEKGTYSPELFTQCVQDYRDAGRQSFGFVPTATLDVLQVTDRRTP